MTQPALNLVPPKDKRAASLWDEPGKHERRFLAFHADHPEVYRELVRLARRAKSRGKAKYGISPLLEVARWHLTMRKGSRDIKINNNHKPYYARLIMEQEPDLADFFETRILTTG